MSPKKNVKKYLFLATLAILVCGVVVFYNLPILYSKIEYSSSPRVLPNTDILKNDIKSNEVVNPTITLNTEEIPVIHIKTPLSVKAVYSSAWVAGSPKYRDTIVKLIDTTELNSIVVDVKDSTGRISFYPKDPILLKYGSAENRIPNIRALTNLLHQKNIYIIGRISVFQDPFMAKLKPEWSITRKSDGKVWKDRKGLSFLDPTKKEVWDYTVSIAREAYREGFDEINFDYIRYPSDGNIKDINYNLAQGQTRSDNIEEFFKYLSEELKKEPAITTSADLFGLTTEVTDDMGIGQVWEKAIPYFDFIAPMVYPSHYPPGSSGYKNPSLYPYEIINKALVSAIVRTKNAKENISKIRPWLQDFNLGATYTEEMIKDEMKAVYDNGLNSWMLWDPKNKYTPSALELEN